MPIRVEVWDQDRGLLTSNDTLCYKSSVNLRDVPWDQIHDLRLELENVPSPDQTLPLQEHPSWVHLLLYKSIDPYSGMLSYYGTPLSAIPIRLDVGDVILISSSYFLTHGIKMTTQSKVRCPHYLIPLPN
jgi:hypothetical protein